MISALNLIVLNEKLNNKACQTQYPLIRNKELRKTEWMINRVELTSNLNSELFFLPFLTDFLSCFCWGKMFVELRKWIDPIILSFRSGFLLAVRVQSVMELNASHLRPLEVKLRTTIRRRKMTYDSWSPSAILLGREGMGWSDHLFCITHMCCSTKDLLQQVKQEQCKIGIQSWLNIQTFFLSLKILQVQNE